MLKINIIAIRITAVFNPSINPFLSVFLPLIKPKMKNSNICKTNKMIEETFLDKPIRLNKDSVRVKINIMPKNKDNFFMYVINFFIKSPN